MSGDSSHDVVFVELQNPLSQVIMASRLVKKNFVEIKNFHHMFGLVFWCAGGAPVHCSYVCCFAECMAVRLGFF